MPAVKQPLAIDLVGHLRELGRVHRLQNGPLDRLLRCDDTIGCSFDEGRVGRHVRLADDRIRPTVARKQA